MSENLKLRLENLTGENQTVRLGRSAEPASGGESEPIDEAESQMRKALGLLGEGQRHRPEAERSEPTHRMADRFNSGLHRRRFVQDGDIPVTVLRRDQGHEAPAHRGAPSAALPTSSRLQRTEAALAAETAAREKAEDRSCRVGEERSGRCFAPRARCERATAIRTAWGARATRAGVSPVPGGGAGVGILAGPIG